MSALLGACAHPAPAEAPWSRTSGPPAAGFATLFIEPAQIAGALEAVPCPASLVADTLEVTSPYEAPAILRVGDLEVGLVPPRGVVRVEGVAPGCYRVALVPPGRGGATTTLEVRPPVR